MKKVFYLLLVSNIFSIFNLVQAQEPTLLVDTSNRWFEYGEMGGYLDLPIEHLRREYYFEGDTNINSISYKKLMFSYSDTIYHTTPFIQTGTYCIAAFRQENLKVFFIKKGNTTEDLYCDFDIELGDTLKYYYNNYPINTVDSITTIPFGNKSRNRYILSNGSSFYDGIGCSFGMLRGYGMVIEGDAYLTCFIQNNIIQEVGEFGTLCELCPKENYPTLIKSVNYSLTLIPHKYTYEFIINNYINTSLYVYSLNGNLIKTIKLNSNKNIIDKSIFKPGLYIYQIRKSGKTLGTGKLII